MTPRSAVTATAINTVKRMLKLYYLLVICLQVPQRSLVMLTNDFQVLQKHKLAVSYDSGENIYKYCQKVVIVMRYLKFSFASFI